MDLRWDGKYKMLINFSDGGSNRHGNSGGFLHALKYEESKAVPAAEEKCVEKVMMVEETKYDDQVKHICASSSFSF
jgi:hypothetical protein